MQEELNGKKKSNVAGGLLFRIFDRAVMAIFPAKEPDLELIEKIRRERFREKMGPQIPPLLALSELLKEPEACRMLELKERFHKNKLSKLEAK
jgi:hypothetical protein